MTETIITGTNQIKEYIKNCFNHLKLSTDEISDIVEAITNNNGKSASEKQILEQIVRFLDNRPLFIRNSQGIENGIYRTMEGNADELIVVGKLIKMGFNCSRVDVTNSKYDAVIDKNGRLLRIQIKATNTNTIDFTCGARAGQQINREVASRQRKLTDEDCDVLIGVLKESAICYVIPASHLNRFGNSASLTRLKEYKENWAIFDNI